MLTFALGFYERDAHDSRRDLRFPVVGAVDLSSE